MIKKYSYCHIQWRLDFMVHLVSGKCTLKSGPCLKIESLYQQKCQIGQRQHAIKLSLTIKSRSIKTSPHCNSSKLRRYACHLDFFQELCRILRTTLGDLPGKNLGDVTAERFSVSCRRCAYAPSKAFGQVSRKKLHNVSPFLFFVLKKPRIC